MGLFRDWFERLPSNGAEPARSRRRVSDAELFAPPGGVRRTGVDGPRQPLVPGAGVEVSELELGDDELSTMFGASTQFSDALDMAGVADPWATTQRHDP
jgi:hypothetical protein